MAPVVLMIHVWEVNIKFDLNEKGERGEKARESGEWAIMWT